MPTPSYPLGYVTDKNGDRFLPITHLDAVRDSAGNTLPEILQRDYPLESKPAEQGSSDLSVVTTGEKYAWDQKLDSGDVDTTIPSSSSSNVPTSDAVKAYVQSVMLNPMSDSSIANDQTFSPRDIVSVDGTMYMADEETSDLPMTKPIAHDGKILTQNGKILLSPSSTTSEDWHSF